MVRGKSRLTWRSDTDPPGELHAYGPPLAANLISPADPAFGHITVAARQLIQFGFDPSDPDIAARAVKVGRENYERDKGLVRSRTAASRHDAAVATGEVVYYMRLGDRVKIGRSTNLASRIATFNPEELLAVEPGGATLESSRHKQFAELRTRGEWFRYESPLTEWIASLPRVEAP
jgi:hypothetical protein